MGDSQPLSAAVLQSRTDRAHLQRAAVRGADPQHECGGDLRASRRAAHADLMRDRHDRSRDSCVLRQPVFALALLLVVCGHRHAPCRERTRTAGACVRRGRRAGAAPRRACARPARLDDRILNGKGATVSSLLPRMRTALSKRVGRVSKHVYQSIRWRALDRPKLLMIVGCQRSGTTLMSLLFDADRDCRVFGEFSALSCVGKDGIRLNPLPDVAAVLSRVPAPLVVMKPLVETQRVRTLLSYFPNSKALFMYRRYADVASSDL